MGAWRRLRLSRENDAALRICCCTYALVLLPSFALCICCCTYALVLLPSLWFLHIVLFLWHRELQQRLALKQLHVARWQEPLQSQRNIP
jgi:hypothetical protein